MKTKDLNTEDFVRKPRRIKERCKELNFDGKNLKKLADKVMQDRTQAQ